MSNNLEQFRSLVNVCGFDENYVKDIDSESYFSFPIKSIIDAENKLRSNKETSIAYLSMEFGLGNSFYNTLTRKDGDSLKNKVIDHEIFSNMKIEDYLFSLKIDKIIGLPIIRMLSFS